MSDMPKQSNSSSIALWLILVVLAVFVVFIIVNIVEDDKTRTKQPTYVPSSSSTKTDWEAYCRDMFPDSPSARRGCVNGATATDNLMDGKYDR